MAASQCKSAPKKTWNYLTSNKKNPTSIRYVPLFLISRKILPGMLLYNDFRNCSKLMSLNNNGHAQTLYDLLLLFLPNQNVFMCDVPVPVHNPVVWLAITQ
ncbi:Hypothetical predicted protein, partial [Mytilus galloprovincialis]